jgi:hypothetical protein
MALSRSLQVVSCSRIFAFPDGPTLARVDAIELRDSQRQRQVKFTALRGGKLLEALGHDAHYVR